MPGYSDYFAKLEPATRNAFNEKHLLTSDGISEATLRRIYQRIYAHRFLSGLPDLVALLPQPHGHRGDRAPTRRGTWPSAHNDHEGVVENVELDVVIWATGFRPTPLGFLHPLECRLERTGDEYKIDENFAMQWDGPADRNIFMQNATREQRGLADPNLSLNAWRSQRILDRLRGRARRSAAGLVHRVDVQAVRR